MGDAARRRLYTPATSRLLCQLWDGVCQWATAHEVTTVSLALTDGVGGSFAESLGRCADVPPLFQIGSQSKVLTAHLIATALSQHGIGIDQPVLDWWPDGRLFLPARFRGTTTRALLSHRTGGFATEEREMQRNDGRHLPKVGSLAPEDLLRHLLSYRPAPSKEAPFVYSDIAYALLALAIKRALGQSLEDLSRQHIEAAGVSDVYCAVHSVPRPRAGALVPGRVDDGGQGQLVPPVDLGALNPALGYVAS
ncbi:MAG: serine hydrolase, partial [Pseudomonadota bacterium]